MTFISESKYIDRRTSDAMDFPLHFSDQLREHLRALRKARGLTQADLGRLLGVGQVDIDGARVGHAHLDTPRRALVKRHAVRSAWVHPLNVSHLTAYVLAIDARVVCTSDAADTIRIGLQHLQ